MGVGEAVAKKGRRGRSVAMTENFIVAWRGTADAERGRIENRSWGLLVGGGDVYIPLLKISSVSSTLVSPNVGLQATDTRASRAPVILAKTTTIFGLLLDREPNNNHNNVHISTLPSSRQINQ